MSAPARAWLTAVRASSSSVASLSTIRIAVPRPQHPAVAVVGVLAQAHIGEHQQLGHGLLDRAHGELHDALLVPRARALLVLGGGDPEQHHRRPIPSAAASLGLLEQRPRSTGARRRASSRSARVAEPAGRPRSRTAAARAGRRAGRSRARARAGRRWRAACACASVERPSSSQVRAFQGGSSRVTQRAQAHARERAEQRPPARAGARARPADAGEDSVDGGVERLQGRLEGEHERDHADRVVEPAADRARGHEREEGERQREQEGEQRGGAHLARERADRHARARRRRARRAASAEQPQRRARPQSRSTNAPIPASIAKATTNAQTAASSAFSASSASRETRPARAARASTCSSRSSATPPAASSTPMNISEMLTATTTANVFSGVRRPCRSVLLTAIGWPIVCRTVLLSVRFSAAKPANAAIRSQLRARSGPGGCAGDHAVAAAAGSAPARSRFGARRARRGCRRSSSSVDRLRGGLLDLFGEAEVRLRERGVRASTARATARARRRCRALPGAPGQTPEESRAAMSRGITTAASTSPDLTFATACARVAVGTASTWLNSCVAYCADVDAAGRRPRRVSPGGVSSTIATRGRDGLRESASPISSAIATRVDDQQREQQPRAARGSAGPCAAASSSARRPRSRQEAHERVLEVAVAARRPASRAARRGCRRTAAAPSASTSTRAA